MDRSDCEGRLLDQIYLDFCGELHTIAPGSTLTFGKEGDLVIDEDDPYLSRKLGIISFDGGAWWLRHLGQRGPLAVQDASTPSYKHITPGVRDALPYGEFYIRFQTRTRSYELEGSLSEAHQPDVLRSLGSSESLTLGWGEVELTPSERALLLTLARPVFEGGHQGRRHIPSNEQACVELGLKTTTFNRRLDYLCRRFAAAGVAGLVSEDNRFARDRRQFLVDHVLENGIITRSDLDAG